MFALFDSSEFLLFVEDVVSSVRDVSRGHVAVNGRSYTACHLTFPHLLWFANNVRRFDSVSVLWDDLGRLELLILSQTSLRLLLDH